MRKSILTILFISFVAGLSAQDGGVSRQVEVNKDYVPEVGRAAKINIEPQMTDTVKLRPVIEYNVTTSRLQTPFTVSRFQAARVDVSKQADYVPFYLKAGAGFPLQSVADLYLYSKLNSGELGAYINHEGAWADLTNDLGQSAGATATRNTVAGYGSKFLRGGRVLSAEAGLDYDAYSAYGMFSLGSLPLNNYGGDPQKIKYTTPRIGVDFGDDFSDCTTLNFRIGGRLYHFSGNEDTSETGVNMYAKLGKSFGSSLLSGTFGVENYSGGGNAGAYRNTIFSIDPSIGFEIGRFTVRGDVNFVINDNDFPENSDSEVFLFPGAEVKFRLSDRSFVYAALSSGITNNGLQALASRNPYVAAGAYLLNTKHYAVSTGIEGWFAKYFSYEASAEIKYIDDYLTFANYYTEGNTARFVAMNQRGGYLSRIGGVIRGTIPRILSNRLEFSAAMNIYKWDFKNFTDNSSETPGEQPKFDADLALKYRITEKFSMGASAHILGERTYYTIIADCPSPGNYCMTTNKVDPVANIGLEAEYKLNPRFRIFAQGRNLANMKLYPYNHYCGMGINFLGGVIISF